MNIYNSILTFSNDFKNCDEVKEFKRLKKKIDENVENKKIIDDFTRNYMTIKLLNKMEKMLLKEKNNLMI